MSLPTTADSRNNCSGAPYALGMNRHTAYRHTALTIVACATALSLAACGSVDNGSATSPASPAPAAPTGQPVGTAKITVDGGAGPVTIRYSINGEPEQTEAGVTTPWTKDYPVYPKVESSVTVSGTATCTITLKGMMVSFQPGPNPTCSYAHYE